MKRSNLFFALAFALIFCSHSVFAAVVWVPAKIANANKGDALLQGGPSGFIGATLAVFGGYWSHSGMITTTGGTALRHNTMEINTIRQNKDACGVPQSLNASDLENGMPGTTGGSIDQALAGQAYWGFNTTTDIVAKPSAANEAAYRSLLNAVGDKFAWLDMYYRIGSYVDMEPQFNNTNTKVMGKGGHCSGTIWFANLQCGKRMNIAYLPASLVDQCAFTLYDNLYALVLEEVKKAAGCMAGVVDTTGTANKIANQITNGFGLNIYNSTDALWRSMEGQIDSLANSPDHLLMNTQVNLSGNYVGVQTPATSYYDVIEVIALANGYYLQTGTNAKIVGSGLYGGTGGTAFDDINTIPNVTVTKIAIRSGSRVDQVSITYSNGTTLTHGGTGGTAYSLTLNSGEYITKVDIRSGTAVDNVKFYTSQGRTLGGGGTGGTLYTVNPPSGYTKMVGFKGRSGSRVDSLGFYFAQ